MRLGRQAEDPAARSVLGEASSYFAIDFKVEDLQGEFSRYQELTSFCLNARDVRGVIDAEVELRIDGPRNPLPFLPEEAPFETGGSVAYTGFDSLCLVLQRDPRHFELRLNPAPDAIVQIDARHFYAPFAAGSLE